MVSFYLDHNSTTPLDERVAKAMARAQLEFPANPASQHRSGQLARRRLEQAKQQILQLLGARLSGRRPDRVVLTSGGTEANNLAVLGLADLNRPQILVSAIEHPSVIGAGEAAARLGFRVRQIPVTRSGVVRLDALENLLDEPTSLVSIMAANNETGVLQPIAAAAAAAHRRGALFHTDAVQAAGKMELDFTDTEADAMTISAHKFHGPRSVGGLLLKEGLPINPLLHGGFQQGGARPGTEDLALAVGLATALQLAVDELPRRKALLRQLRDQFLSELDRSIPGAFVVNGEAAVRLDHTLNLSFPGLERQALLLAADAAGIAFSTGSACASGSSEPSPVLLAMGLEETLVSSAVRISFGITNTVSEVTEAARLLATIVSEFRAAMAPR